MIEPQPEYLIEQLLPAEEIHLIAGPTGAGKTRWLFHMLLEWQAGLPILGHKSNPVPWVYVTADRSKKAAIRTLTDMQIDPARINIIDAWDRHLSLNGIIEEVKKSRAGLAVIEAFGSFCDGNHKAQVKSYLAAVHTTCQVEHLTIMGVMESPKMKPKDRYENPRQRVSGVATWGHFTETIFVIEPANPDDPHDPARKFYACPRNGPGYALDAEITAPHGSWGFVKR